MKYQIIEEVNGNDERHFYVKFYDKGFFGWWAWRFVEDFRYDCPRRKTFATYEAAKHHVNLYRKTTNIVEEGEV